MRPVNLPPIGFSHRRLTFDEVHSIVVAGLVPEPNSGCLLWEGGIFRQRPYRSGNYSGRVYGSIKLNGTMVGTHRVAYQGAYGPIPDGMHVLHRCDVGLCCNPAHLYLGTNDENHADKAAKDRGRKRLTHAKAGEIHKMRAAGMSQGKIAQALNVNQSNVSRILAGKRRAAALLTSA